MQLPTPIGMEAKLMKECRHPDLLPVTMQCRDCGAEFKFEPFRMAPRWRPEVCPECADKRIEADWAAQNEGIEAAHLARWEAICPPLYQETDPGLLNQAKLKEVLAWEYGPKGLLLVGQTATGKTRTAWMLLKKLIQSGLYVEAFDCMGFSHKCSRMFGDFVGAEWIERLVGVDVVYLDDLGKGKLTERVEAEMFGLIERRCAQKRPIIATLNMTGQTMQSKLTTDRGEPLVRRLREFCSQVVFKEPLDASRA